MSEAAVLDVEALKARDPMEFFVFDETVAEKVRSGPEAVAYLVIDQIGGFLWRTQHDFGKGRISESDWAAMADDRRRMAESQAWVAAHATRFGVAYEGCTTLNQSAEYWKWFRWWDAYVKGLSDADFKRLDALLQSGDPAAEAFRPAGDWRTHSEPDGAVAARVEALTGQPTAG